MDEWKSMKINLLFYDYDFKYFFFATFPILSFCVMKHGYPKDRNIKLKAAVAIVAINVVIFTFQHSCYQGALLNHYAIMQAFGRCLVFPSSALIHNLDGMGNG